MGLSNLRPLLLLLAGAAFGALITFGLLSQKPSVQANSVLSQVPPKDLKAPSPAKEESDPSKSPALVNDEGPSDSDESASLDAQAAVQTLQKQHVPVRPVPTPKMVLQANGLPVGVTPDAGIPNPEVYKRLPGVQPPLINRDGRDIGQEAIQMLQTHQEETPFPGGIPSASATPIPTFPRTVEEANRARADISPSQAQ